jgi:hypothetical protein
MYSNTAAVLRPDIMGDVEEAKLPNEVYIADQALPIYNSTTKSGQYPKFKATTSQVLKDISASRARGAGYPRVVRSFDNDTFDCVDYGLEEAIDDAYDRRDLGRFFDVEVATARRALQNVKIGREIRGSSLLMATTFTATAAAVNYTETNIATINFMKDVQGCQTRLLQYGRVADTIVMSDVLFNQIIRSTLFRGLSATSGVISASVAPLASAQQMAQIAGVGQVLVGKAYYDAAKHDKAVSATSIWGTTYIWVGSAKGGELMDSGAARTMVWSEDAPSLYVTETYREESNRSDVVRVRMNVDEKVLDAKAGQLITTSYSAS